MKTSNIRIIICGGNGSGKSTLGKELAGRIGVPFLDIEDYYFPANTTEYCYDKPREKEEVEQLLKKDMMSLSQYIVAMTRPNFSNDINSMFSSAIYIKVPKSTRLERVKERSFKRFGKRIMPGGDLYVKEKVFFEMVRNRKESEIITSLEKLRIPIVEINGERPLNENVEILLDYFNL